MKPKTILSILLASFLILLALLFSGCVPTYKIIHSGTIQIERQPDDVSQVIFGDPGWETPPSAYTLEFHDTDIDEITLGDSLTFVPGGGIILIQDGETITIQSVDDEVKQQPDPYDDFTLEIRPSELKACQHKERTSVFLIGDRKTCHCLDCGAWWDGECQ